MKPTQEPEPVAWELRKGKTDRVLIEITNNPRRAHDWKVSLEEVVPLYTALPQREWQGLTDEEIDEVFGSPMRLEPSGLMNFVRAIEAKLKEKNT